MSSKKRVWQRGCVFLLAVALLLTGGCRKGSDPKGYEKVAEAAKKADEVLKGQGAKFTRRHYGVGDAWSIDMTGATLNEETFKAMKTLLPISELKLAKTNVTDEDLKSIASIVGVLNVVDLKDTGITDAGLMHLHALKFLENIDVRGTKVTQGGKEAYQKARDKVQLMPLYEKRFRKTKFIEK